MTAFSFRCVTAAGLVFLVGGSVFSAPPTIESLAPGIGQRGTEFTLTIQGARLTDAQELLLYKPGVVCTKLESKSENEVVATLKCAPECKLGEHSFRLRTKGGASELRTLHITPFPVVRESEPNDTRDTAQSVPLNVSIAGIVASGDSDFYAVTLKKGQRLAAEVVGVRLGAELTDTAIAIYSPDGKLLATADDTPLFRQDPFATVIAPTDGTYTVQVRDTNFGGGDTNRYVLHLGTFARPSAVFPPGGQAGTEVKVTLFGDAGGERTVSLKLPQAGSDFEFFPTDAGGTAPTPNPFRVSAFPNVNEAEPNDEPQHANAAVAWPVAFNGIIAKPGDVDSFRFRAKRGDVIDVQAFAFRIGSPADTVIAVLDARGELVASNDDDETHDSRVEVTIPADGEYLLRVTDKRKQGGPAFIYRVELSAPQPGIAVFLAERARKTQDRHTITIPRGNRVTAYLAVRRDGFAGAVSLAPSQLPTGVTAKFGTIPEGEYLLPVVFEAAADAPIGARLIDIAANAQPIRGGFTQVVTLVRGPGDSALHAVTLDKLAVVVIDQSPFSVDVLPLAAPLATDGTLEVTVKVNRRKDFAEPLEVSFPCLPPGVETPTSVVIPANETEAKVTLVASSAADVGDWKLIAEATIARPGRAGRDPSLVGMNGLGTGTRPSRRSIESVTPVASQVQTVRVSEPPVRGAFSPAAGEQGKTVNVIFKLEGEVKADFTAKIVGLPPRASAKPVAIKPGTRQIEFVVAIDATTPAGEHKSLVCELAGSTNGQQLVYRLGRDGSLKVDAPGAVKTDATGKPLSPLDALRLEQNKKN